MKLILRESEIMRRIRHVSVSRFIWIIPLSLAILCRYSQCIHNADERQVEFVVFVTFYISVIIVMEYIAGGELFARIVAKERNGRGLGETLTKFYAYQMLDAIQVR